MEEMYGEENIISRLIHVDETTPHLHCDFVPLTVKSVTKDVIGDKRKCAGRKRNFLKNAMKAHEKRTKTHSLVTVYNR